MSNGTKVTIFLGAAILLVVVMLATRKPGVDGPRDRVEDQADDEPAAAKGTAKKNGKQLAAKSPTKNAKQLRMEKEAKLGFADVPVTRKGSKIGVAVKVDVEERCEWGDFDVLEKNLKASGKNEVLVTLEPLGVSGKPFVAKKMKLADLKNDGLKELEIPDSKKIQPLGFYICIDGRNTGRCGDKPDANMRRAVHEDEAVVAEGDNVPKRKQPADRNYFFQSWHVQDGSLQVHTDPLLKGKGYEEIARHYEASADGRVSATQAVGRMKNANENVMSIPPEVTKTGMHLTLPKMNPAKCAGGAPKGDQPASQASEPVAAPDAETLKKGPARVWTMPEKDALGPPGAKTP